MKTSNFKTSELQEYYNENRVVFFNYKKVFILYYSNNSGFYFYELVSARIYSGLPYTLRGKFHAFTYNDTFTKKHLNS